MAWSEDNNKIHRRFEFNNFAEALAFVNQVGELAEAVNHHPNIKLGWGYVEISLTSHDAGEVTERDHELATQIDELVDDTAN